MSYNSILYFRYFIKHNERQEIFNFISNTKANCYLHTSSFIKNENEVNRILSIPENKLNHFNVISLSEVIHALEELKNIKKFVTVEDLEKLLTFSLEAVKREFCSDNTLIRLFWEFTKNFKGINFIKFFYFL